MYRSDNEESPGRGRQGSKDSTSSSLSGTMQKKADVANRQHKIFSTQKLQDAEKYRRKHAILPVVPYINDVQTGLVLRRESPMQLFMMAIALKLTMAISRENYTSREQVHRQKQLNANRFARYTPDGPTLLRDIIAGKFWVSPPDPSAAKYRAVNTDVYFIKRLFIWLPSVAFNISVLCPNKGCGRKCRSRGFNLDHPGRRVQDFGDVYYVISRRYTCDTCASINHTRNKSAKADKVGSFPGGHSKKATPTNAKNSVNCVKSPKPPTDKSVPLFVHLVGRHTSDAGKLRQQTRQLIRTRRLEQNQAVQKRNVRSKSDQFRNVRRAKHAKSADISSKPDNGSGYVSDLDSGDEKYSQHGDHSGARGSFMASDPEFLQSIGHLQHSFPAVFTHAAAMNKRMVWLMRMHKKGDYVKLVVKVD